jgi:hypothetical protein
MSHISPVIHDEDLKEKDVGLEHHEHVVHDANRAGLTSAIAAEDQEHMSVLKALKLFPKATFWSFMVSFMIVSGPLGCSLSQADGRSWRRMTTP